MKFNEKTTFIRDVESCFIWLNKQLELTPAEKAVLIKQTAFNIAKNNPITEKRDYIIKSYGKRTALDLSRELNIPTMTIYKIWQNSGLNINPTAKLRKISIEQISWMIKNCKKFTAKELSEKLNVSLNTVYKTARKYKIKLPVKHANAGVKNFNDTELKILSLIAKGQTDNEIKNELKTSLAYIRNCIHSLYKKLGLTSVTYPVRRVRAALFYNEINV